MEGRPTLSDSLLTVTFRHRVGAVALDVNFRLTRPWTVLFGPSGSGKTTVLRAIAGFVRPDAGRIETPRGVFFDSLENIFLPTHKRPVRSAGQVAKLFPHKSVAKNIGFGIREKPEEVRQIVSELMTAFRLDALGERMPQDLSGGERQRVTVAQALASAVSFHDAPLLLLDEPLAGLDIATRDEVMARLREWTTKYQVPVLSVTHDLGEAFQLDAEVIKIANGAVVEQGHVGEVLTAERQQLLKQLHP
ncbi:MAG: ATP-binding cassette domain-containing protein [Acidobacteria bacterium]|nr:ATP-binding cassette domain-containing protein [Acidobacteriota bacterium]